MLCEHRLINLVFCSSRIKMNFRLLNSLLFNFQGAAPPQGQLNYFTTSFFLCQYLFSTFFEKFFQVPLGSFGWACTLVSQSACLLYHLDFPLSIDKMQIKQKNSECFFRCFCRFLTMQAEKCYITKDMERSEMRFHKIDTIKSNI